MLVDGPVGASPAGGACSVATVVMLDNGKGDRPAESSGVKVSVGWVEAQSDPPAILLGYVFFVRFIRKQGLRYFRVQTEIELAEQIHRSLVPPIVRHASRDEFYGLSAPSGEMGGDLVDLVQDGDKWIGYLADVSGHGVPSGVLMAMVKSAVRMRHATSSEPQVLLEDLNRVISELIAAETFVTLAFVSLGKSNGLHFATAGQLPILHFRCATGSVCELSLPIHPLEFSKGRSSRVLTWNSQAAISRFS